MTEQRQVYLCRAGANGEDEDLAIENGLAILGFREVPSVEGVKGSAEVVKAVGDALPNAKPKAVMNHAAQLWAFVGRIREGDIVVLPRKRTSQIAIGIVRGPYVFREVGGAFRHTREVAWTRPDVPRTAFEQDLLYSFGAFSTVCKVSRNDAERRVSAVLAGGSDPGHSGLVVKGKPVGPVPADVDIEDDAPLDLMQAAHDQVLKHIQSRFAGHALSELVEAVLQADGWVTRGSPPGADGGVDILAGRGPLGLDAPRLCVQVKSQNSPADVIVYRTLQGSMQSFKADQGLLVCWGGFNKVVLAEAKQGHFTVRLWNSTDLVEAIYQNYDRLPAKIQAELPLTKVWMLVPKETDE